MPMLRLVLATAAAVVVTATAGCGQAADSGAGIPVWQSGSPAGTSAAPGPDRLSAACPLLPATEVVRVLGSDKGTTLEATEGEKETAESGSRFTCGYGRDGRQVLILAVAEQAGPPAAGVEAVIRESGEATKKISGLGDTAATYTSGGFRYVVAAVPHAEGHRLVHIGASAVVPQAKLTELAATVVRGF